MIVCISNQKGGVGKTTTAVLMSIGLAEKGYKVLAIDADGQRNLSALLQTDSDGKAGTIYELMRGDRLEACIESVTDNLFLVPGDAAMYTSELEFLKIENNRPVVNLDLLKVHESELRRYDFVIIDTGPNLGTMLMNALEVSDKVIIPTTPDSLAVDGIEALSATINAAKARNNGLQLSGILLTCYDRANISRLMAEDAEELAGQIGTKVFRTRIRRGKDIRESHLTGENPMKLKRSGVGQDYAAFIEEFLEEVNGGNKQAKQSSRRKKK